jgi:L,D-transpeptidase catalytic domain
MKVPALIAALAGIAMLAAAAFLVLDDDGSGGPEPAGGVDPLEALRALVLLPRLGMDEPPPDDIPGPSYPLATVRPGQRVDLLDSPGGRVVARVGDETEFGSLRRFWVAEVMGDWFGVPAPELGNGELGWIRDDRTVLDVSQTHYSIVADVSEQTVDLRYGDRVLDRIPVTVGTQSSPTPLGEYAVTDGLVGEGVGPYYGCCILALTGHQPNLPSNWLGGDRIAIHGTPDAIGGARSAGCLRASDPDIVSLFARVPLGAPVFIGP